MFVLSGWIFNPALRTLLEVANHFLELHQRSGEQEHVVSTTQVCEAVTLRITQTYAHAFRFLPAFHIIFQCHVEHRIEEQAGQRITLFRSPLDLEHVAFFVR